MFELGLNLIFAWKYLRHVLKLILFFLSARFPNDTVSLFKLCKSDFGCFELVQYLVDQAWE